MVDTQHRALLAIATALLITGFTVAYGQVLEEMMEPEEIGLRDIESLTTSGAKYVGNEVCKDCHETSYRKWLETKHARAFVPMRSTMAFKIGDKVGISAESPAKSGECLKCHATAHDVPAEYRGKKFRMGEGVSCEKCHGPGGKHVEAAAAGNASNELLIMPTEKDCMVCHASKPSHEMVCANCHGSREDHVEMMMRGRHGEAIESAGSGKDVCLGCHRLRSSHMTFMEAAHFSYDEALKKIAHPEERN